MFEKKPWYKSKTIVAAIVAVVLSVAAACGVEGLGGEKDAIVEAVMEIAVAVAGVIAIYGRVKAKENIGKKET